MSERQPRSRSAGVLVDNQTINERPATDGESQHAMVERILRERSKERALRRVNSHRLQRFAAVAKETSHYSTAGVTEDLLKQKMARHHLTERGEDCGSFRSTSSRTSDITRETRGTSSSWTTTATVTEMRSNVSSSTQHSGGGGGGQVAAGMQQRRRIDRISGGGGSATSSSSRGAAEGDPDEDDEDTRQLLENGGHICVVKSNFAELLLSVPAVSNGVAKAATSENMAVMAGGGNDDGPASPPPSTSPTTLAGAIPLSLRGLVVSRKASTGAAPPLAVASSSPRGGPPTPPMPSDAAASTAGEGAKQGSGTAAARPAPRRASAAVPWPSSSSSVGQPKSILKRHPIPRKHRRRVHFSELHRFVEASHVLETSSSLRLSKDGPPVAFSILDLEVGGATTAPLGAAASGSNINSGEIDAGTPAGWGPDSAEFNREWGLRSPVNMTGVRSTENSSDTTQQQPSSSGQRTTKHRGRLVEKGGQQRAVDFLAASYHTGLSMEEARLLSAIAEVNAKLRETGFQKHRSTEAGASSSTRSNHAQPSTRPSQAAPPPAVATTTTTTAPTANRSAGGGEDSDGGLAYHLAHPPAAASLLPEPSSAGRHLGGIVVDAFLHQPYQPRSTSAPPTAATARNAPTPTPFGNARQVIVVPQETNLPAHVAAGLPKRKSDHQGLTRRDRFGKRMSVVGR